jgi:PAS domain-containing protein
VTKSSDFPWRRLGELLIERDLVDERELEDALSVQAATGRRLGEILVTQGALAEPELIAALAEQYGLDVQVAPQTKRTDDPADSAPADWQPLGRILVERGSLGRETLRAAIAEQQKTGGRLGTILVDGGHVSAIELVEALAEQHGLAPPSLLDAALADLGPEPAYLVIDGDGGILFRTDAFLDATDFAFELLEGKAPPRLEIVRIEDGRREQVWSYAEEQAAAVAAAPRDSLEIYGFDVTRWTGPPRR